MNDSHGSFSWLWAIVLIALASVIGWVLMQQGTPEDVDYKKMPAPSAKVSASPDALEINEIEDVDLDKELQEIDNAAQGL
ncbi:MAG: hypothetical protein AAB463_01120 [Patescibacteria group bacterium]